MQVPQVVIILPLQVRCHVGVSVTLFVCPTIAEIGEAILWPNVSVLKIFPTVPGSKSAGYTTPQIDVTLTEVPVGRGSYELHCPASDLERDIDVSRCLYLQHH